MRLLITLAILPIVVIAILIYKADRLEKEPTGELLKAFLMGIASVVLTLIISYLFGINNFTYDKNNYIEIAIYAFIGISLIEESSKWICSYFFLRKNKNYDYIFDGIVYTVFVSLGFAAIENLLYTLAGGVSTALVRAITTVPAHAFFAISSGYYLSLSKIEKIKLNKSKSMIYLFLSLLAPFLLHGFYDFCLLSENTLLLYTYLIFVVSLYSLSIYRVRKTMKEERKFNNQQLEDNKC